MSKRVLIAYGSRYGSTEEIARATVQLLEKEGLETQLLDLRHTKQKEWPALASFDGILVGSGIKMFRWVGEAKTFLKKHADELTTLKAKGLVVGFFVSCGSASTPEGHAEAKDRYLAKVLTDLGIKAEVTIYDAFGGVLDLPPSAPMGFLDKRMLGMAAKQMVKDTGIHLTEGARNDLRDWDQIQTFTEQFAQLLKAGGGAN
jgi:menaquinone-dependent protoporphyrinogen oxidase